MTVPLQYTSLTRIAKNIYELQIISLWCFFPIRVRATDRHCRKMRRNNKFGAKDCNLATTIGERKIASENFCLASERHLRLKSLPCAALC